MSFRVLTRLAARANLATSPLQRRTMAQLIPALGSEDAMKEQAIAQIRARVEYQKSLKAAHPAHDDADEMYRWLNITFWVGFPIMTLSMLYSFFFDEHKHRIHGPLPDHMNIRSKEFPWECGQCDLFDSACWKKCREEKK